MEQHAKEAHPKEAHTQEVEDIDYLLESLDEEVVEVLPAKKQVTEGMSRTAPVPLVSTKRKLFLQRSTLYHARNAPIRPYLRPTWLLWPR